MTRITQINEAGLWMNEGEAVHKAIERISRTYRRNQMLNYNRVPMGKRSLRKVPKERREFVEAYRHRFNIWVGEALPDMDAHMWSRLVAWKMAWGQ